MTNIKDVQPSRRAVAKGAAWAIPTVAVASGAPAIAASTCKASTKFDQFNSGNLQGSINPTDDCCLKNGDTVTVTFHNAGTSDVVMRGNSSSGMWALSTTGDITVAGGESASLTFTYVYSTQQCAGSFKYDTTLRPTPAAGSTFTAVSGTSTWTHTW